MKVMDWFAKVAVTHSWSLFWTCRPRPSVVTGWLNDGWLVDWTMVWLISNVRLSKYNTCIDFFFCRSSAQNGLFIVIAKWEHKTVVLAQHFAFLLGKFVLCGEWVNRSPSTGWDALFLPFPFAPPSLPTFSCSFCISLASRCYQCSHCQGWKSSGAHETPDNGRMLSSPWVSYLVFSVCAVIGGLWWGLWVSGKHLSSSPTFTCLGGRCRGTSVSACYLSIIASG